MKTGAFILTALCALTATKAEAAPAKNLDNRFVPMHDEASVPLTNDMNVETWGLQFPALPAFAMQQVEHVLKSCFTHPRTEDIAVFAYESEYTRQNRLPPNYLIDVSKLAGTQQKPCNWTPVCSEAGCRLFGLYATDENRWEITFAPHALQWGVQPISQYRAARGKTVTQFEIWTISNSPQCANPKPDTEACLSDYAWAGNRLTPIKVNR